MFYAASEITFWILLAAIIGGGIGYGLNEARSVRLGKRLTESRADAPLERELAIAWDTIEDLNKRLQVAHETIRKSTTRGATDVAPSVDAAAGAADSPAEAAAAPAAVMPVHVDPVPPKRPMVAAVPRPIDHAPEPEPTAAPVAEPAAQLVPPDVTFDAPAQAAEQMAATLAGRAAGSPDTDDAVDTADDDDADGVIGSRLSQRVASASIANQADITNQVDFD